MNLRVFKISTAFNTWNIKMIRLFLGEIKPLTPLIKEDFFLHTLQQQYSLRHPLYRKSLLFLFIYCYTLDNKLSKSKKKYVRHQRVRDTTNTLCPLSWFSSLLDRSVAKHVQITLKLLHILEHVMTPSSLDLGFSLCYPSRRI